tara:strand:- start:304 stop:1530 length:1227 start_codon:yes stop_codon:yes gene_type:complete
MQYFVQIRRADGSTYPTTVEADSLAEARRIAQNVGESGETVENITENTSGIGTGDQALTSQAMTQALEDGPTTLDNLYREFERNRALAINNATDRPIGEGQTSAPLRTTGNEAIGAGFQEGSYQGPMMPVAPRAQDFLTGSAPQETLMMAQRPQEPFLEGLPEQTPTEYSSFNKYIDNFLSDNAQLSGYALGLDKQAPNQGLAQSVIYGSGPIGSYFQGLFPEVQATYMAEDVAKNMNLAEGANPVTGKSFDQFTSEMLSGGQENSLFNKQTTAFNNIVAQYKKDLNSPDKTNIADSVAMSFSDNAKNASTVVNMIRGMATSRYGDNYMRYVNPRSDALYDAWSREQANKMKASAPDMFKGLDSEAMAERAAKNPSFAGKESFMEYTARSLGVPFAGNNELPMGMRGS